MPASSFSDLVITLKALPATVRGIYKVGGVDGRMPARTLFLEPAAADSYVEHLLDWVVVSDVLRSAESSLSAVRRGRGAQAPGFSAHNYGKAIDIDTKATMRSGGFDTKQALDEYLEPFGWFCHRRDHKLDSESWHYNYLGVGYVVSPKSQRTSGDVEALIVQRYGAAMVPGDAACQRLLASLKMYSGRVNGIVDDLTSEAVRVLQRAWASKRVTETGKLDANTRRTLAFVCAAREVVA
jgi:hypothetical protein